MRLPQCRIWFSAKAMAGKKGRIPSVSDLLRQSKRQKTVLTSIKEACATLRSAVDSLDECDMSELDLSEKATLAVAKHSLSAVVKSIKLMRSMPPTLGRQRKTIIASDCNISVDEVSSLVNLLEDHCHCDRFCDTDVSIVLTPPAIECFDCKRTLVTNHITIVTPLALAAYAAATWVFCTNLETPFLKSWIRHWLCILNLMFNVHKN